MFDTLLVANRGEIARRVIRSARELGIRTVAVYSDADAELPYVSEADTAVDIGDSQPARSYLNVSRLIEAAQNSFAKAIHPGYGFLSEDPEFARAVQDAGLIWVGPDPDVIASMGNKVNARNIMANAGVPIVAGTTEPITEVDAAHLAAKVIGYPVMLKASAGGGGIGMSVVRDEEQLSSAFATAQVRAKRFFNSAELLLERYVESARHVEVQVLGLADGRIVCLGERDCSVQRRHQKVVEEAPAAQLTHTQRSALHDAAIRAAASVHYRGAGTVEFLYDTETGDFSFLEMNTRLQVEHPVTEMVTGIDIVAAQLHVAAGEPVNWDPAEVTHSGHAVELRVYAEDSKRFLPSPGTITNWREPSGEGVRVDSAYRTGNTVSTFYDPLLAKLCVWGRDRDEALSRASRAVATFEIDGPKTNLEFLTELLASSMFVENRHDTNHIARMRSLTAC